MTMIACTCASTPPTIPVYRDHHLPECEISVAVVGCSYPRRALLEAGITSDIYDVSPLVLTGDAEHRAAAILARRGAIALRERR